MLFLVKWEVDVPSEFPKGELDEIMVREREYSKRMRSEGGPWKHIWRVAARGQTVSIFEVATHDELHIVITQLPMHRFLTINEVTALSTHPASNNV